MTTRHSTFFVDKINTIDYCNTQMYQVIGSTFELPFEIKPTKGEHDFNKCEGCQRNLKHIEAQIKVKFEKFPFCCEGHKKLAKEKWFNKTSFGNAPLMTANKVVFTIQHIVNNIEKEDWYQEITNYIEAVIISFGQLPKGYGGTLFLGDYFHLVKDMVGSNKEMPKEKRIRIVEYIDSYSKEEKDLTTDFNVLLNTYQEWLKIFPFEIEYFKGLKQEFERRIPVLAGKPVHNPYSGLAKAKMQTQSGLIESLISTTKDLLSKINGATLYKKGLLTNANKIRIDLIVGSRLNDINQGYKNNLKNPEERYRNILKAWFADEKRFMDEITPLLNTESDLDFIKGQITLRFIPQGDSGYFTVTKDEVERRYTLEKYFDLELSNWEFAIDAAPTKKDRLQATNNAIFRFRKEYFDYTHPGILKLKEKTIEHLKHAIEYIKASYEETQLPQQPEFNYNTQIFKNHKAAQFFEALVNRFPKVNDDYAYIFRRLIKDGYMFDVSQKTYKDFCSKEPYYMSLDKIKTIEILENEKRNALYSAVLNGIK